MAQEWEIHWLCVSVQSSGVVAGEMEHFRWTLSKEFLDISDILLSAFQHVFDTGVDVSSLD